MPLAPKTVNTESNKYFGIYAQQTMGAASSLDVFLATIPLEGLLENGEVLLLSDLTNKTQWAMHQLVQRNINEKRVDQIRDQFLRSPRKVKFFPSITVVLLPISEEAPKHAYDSSESVDSFNHIDGITLTHAEEGEHDVQRDYFACLSWDKSKLNAIVVDGQHRVKAIRKFIANQPKASYESDSMPVAFIIFPPTKSDGGQFPVLEATREIFIDINNTPKNVSEQRLVFIDDRNLLRRITARTLGVQMSVDNEQDIYQEIATRDHFLEKDFEGLLNRYIVGEDWSDDVSSGWQRNHKTLLPWEVTHIMTVHEQIIKDVLLARDKRIGLGADLQRLCQLINKNLATQYESFLDEDAYERAKEKLREQHELSDAAKPLFRKLIEARQRANESRKSIDESDDEERNQLRAIDDAYFREMRDDDSFYVKQRHARELLNQHFFKVSNLVSYVFNNLWFVQEQKKIMTEGVGDGETRVCPEDIYRLVYEAKINSQDLGTDDEGLKRALQVIESMNNDDFCEESLGRRLAKLVKSIDQQAQTNTLRKIVGQQALFVYFRQKNDGRLLQDAEVDVELRFLNTLGIENFFSSDTSLKLKIFNHSIQIAPLSGTLLKADGNMNPGLDHAKRAAVLLLCIRLNIFKREHFQGAAAPVSPQLGEQKSLITALGSCVYKKLEHGGHVEQVDRFIKWAADQDNLEQWLTDEEIKTLRNEDKRADEGQQTKRLMKAKKVVGGMVLESIVSVYSSPMSASDD